MAHHGSTPASVLEAPTLTPVVVWDPTELVRVRGSRRGTRARGPAPSGSVAAVLALAGDTRREQLAGRRKARAKANRDAKALAAEADRAHRREMRRYGAPRVFVDGVDITRSIVPGSVRPLPPFRPGDSYSGRGA